jgi:hypothetical protein
MYAKTYDMAPRIFDPKPKRPGSEGMASKARREAESRPRIIVSIERRTPPRRKIRDRDNLVGGTKPFTDVLKLAWIIESDDEETIELQVNQTLTRDPKEVGTLVEITWPD